MKRIALAVVLLTLVTGAITSCTPLNAQGASSYDHVIILGFDGWGTSSFNDADMPFLKSMVPKSAWTLHKRSILPTSSACNWATMFKGAGPETHGYIAWNTKTPAFDIAFADSKGNFPSLFSLYREKYPEREMGYLYQWEGMKYIFDIEDFSFSQQFPVSSKGSNNLKDAAVSYIKEKKPGLAFFVWDYPDAIGHGKGWYSEEYMEGLNEIDCIIESVVNACAKAGILARTLFVITSDHGGHDSSHGQPIMSDLETPFFLFGYRVKPGVIQLPFIQYDVAAIIADYLDLEQPFAWRGKSPASLFEE